MRQRKYNLPLTIVAVLLCMGPIWGLLGTVIGMIGAFSNIAQGGSGQPQVLADHISFALWTTALGLITVPFGIGLLIYASRRPKEAPPPLLKTK
ncbi:MotA/TolQ/ExbB proton channel family protein [Rubellicoccus peritrichatus]|uniref:MotA/TolQ/ExbB proton channel family protein n=1 Tax=Rubellicoccus peritrichatus TaxID=3080537 RepID=UPI003CE4A9C9